ncbi:MAG TPA: hypothetical protein VKC89_00950 [Patescibacteria group bacterium]|nr:hypothetical protein [Patescibacteria group bacterium]
MDQDQNQEKEKSSFDHALDLLNFGQNAYGAGRNLGRAARFASKVGRLAPIIANPVVATIGGIALIMIILIFVLGNQAESTTPTPTPIANQNINGIVNITGATPQEIQTVNDALSIGLFYPGYKNKLTSNGPVNITFQQNLTWQGGQVDGLTLAGGDEITIRSGLSQETLKYTILHETGHILIMRNPRTWQSYPFSDLVSADPACYSSLGFLKTYPFANTGGGGGETVESFAESVSQFLLKRPPLENFPTLCPNTYNWELKNIFQETQ